MFVVCDEISGTRATAIDEINVPGIVISGSAIPVIIPNSAIACDSEKPNVVNRSGIIKAINICTIEEAVLASVIDELCLTISSILPFGDMILFPFLKYITITSKAEKIQATESDNVAIMPSLDIPGKAIKIIKQIILINCSKNSEKLIEKNFFCPQRALRSIE